MKKEKGEKRKESEGLTTTGTTTLPRHVVNILCCDFFIKKTIELKTPSTK